MLKSKLSVLALTALLLFVASPVVAQQKLPAAPRKPPAATQVAEPVPTFDTLLGADNYRVYSEVRNVGSLVRSEGFNGLLEPAVELVAPPRQFSTIVKWIKTHADPLAGSRMFAASWPSKKNLPAVLVVIEFASAEEAKKLERELRRFLPKLDPKPAASPSPSAGPQPGATPASNNAPAAEAGTFAQLHIKQTGALILVSEKPISLRDLKPRGGRLLAEDPNFALARNRFASEAIFVYVDFKAIEKEEREQRQKWEEEEKRREELAIANPPEPPVDPDVEVQPTVIDEDEFSTQSGNPTLRATAPDPPASNADSEHAAVAEAFNTALFPLSMALFGGRAKYPEAVGAALAFEGDSYTVRALVVNSPENRSLPLPFLPQLRSGSELTPSSPNVLPGDADLFVVLSLEYSQVYEGMVKAFAEQPWLTVATSAGVKRPMTPFSNFEEKFGIKVKEELIPLLGNEIAFALPKASPAATQTTLPDNEDRRSVRLPELIPVIAISLKEREAVKRLIPKMIESLGLKGANALAHTEKRDDTEIISYANMFSYAFIGDFLIFTPDPALTRRSVDSYLTGGTLSSNSRFRNATRWQSRQIQGQVYVASDLVESYVFLGKHKPQNVSQPVAVEPLTYMLSDEGLGPMHEVRIPRGLLNLVVAGFSSKAEESPIFTNESIAKNVLRTVASAQATFKETKGNGSYGSLDELISAGLLVKDMLEKYGYKIELVVLSIKFEVTATPVEYGKSGRRSFFIDESGVLRAGDHGGGAATLSDKPINE